MEEDQGLEILKQLRDSCVELSTAKPLTPEHIHTFLETLDTVPTTTVAFYNAAQLLFEMLDYPHHQLHLVPGLLYHKSTKLKLKLFHHWVKMHLKPYRETV